MSKKKKKTAALPASASSSSSELVDDVPDSREIVEEEEEDVVADYPDENCESEDESPQLEDISDMEETVTKTVKSTRKRKRLPTKFDKMVKSVKVVTRRKESDFRAARAQHELKHKDAVFMEPLIKASVDRHSRRKSVSDKIVSEVLSKPVGFTGNTEDEHTLEHRIIESSKQEFKIQRTLELKRTRYVPFGSDKFYKDTRKFYSEPTELCCQWCTEPFSTLPIPLAVRYHQNQMDNSDFVFHVTGQFCSPSCMLAMAKNKGKKMSIARLLLKRIYGLKISVDIPLAPDPLSLQKFGGMYTIEQFRATGGSGITTHPVLLPVIPVSVGITEIESTETVVTEVGGKELARRRIKVRGGGIGGSGSLTPFSNPSHKNTQRGKFSTAPSIEEQINASDRKLRLQMNDQTKKKKQRPSIMQFMKLKETNI